MKHTYEWRPVRFRVFIVITLVSLAIVLAACLVWTALDQARIDAIPRPEPVLTSFTFCRPACGFDAMGCETFHSYETGKPYAVAWTTDGLGNYAITQGLDYETVKGE